MYWIWSGVEVEDRRLQAACEEQAPYDLTEADRSRR